MSYPPSDSKPTPDSMFDHTSVISTVNSLLGVKDPKGALSKRVEWAANFDYLLKQRTTPRTVGCPP